MDCERFDEGEGNFGRRGMGGRAIGHEMAWE